MTKTDTIYLSGQIKPRVLLQVLTNPKASYISTYDLDFSLSRLILVLCGLPRT